MRRPAALLGILVLVALQAVSGLLPHTGRSLQSVDELPEGSQAQQNGCEATQVAKCQAAGQVCLNKACVPDACDNEKALSPRCRAICHLMAPSLAYACSECEGKVVCTRDNVLPMLGAINKRRPWRMLQSRKRNAGVQSSAA